MSLWSWNLQFKKQSIEGNFLSQIQYNYRNFTIFLYYNSNPQQISKCKKKTLILDLLLNLKIFFNINSKIMTMLTINPTIQVQSKYKHLQLYFILYLDRSHLKNKIQEILLFVFPTKNYIMQKRESSNYYFLLVA